MPIQCLTNIRFPSGDALISRPVDAQLAHLVAGIYQFEIAQLGQEVALFNDGFPALMIMPQRHYSSQCELGELATRLGGLWLSLGVFSQQLWQPCATLPGELLTIVQFYPSAWQKINGRSLPAQPAVYDLEAYDAALAQRLYALYEAPSMLEALTGILSELTSPGLTDCKALAFEQATAAHQPAGQGLMADAHPKWIQRQFKKSLGIGPYQFEQLQRFLQAYQALGQHEPDNLHGIAYACGYYDANHLIKDFKKYVGLAPRQYFQARGQQHKTP